METKFVFMICLIAISNQIVIAENGAGGYFYDNPNVPQNLNLISQIRPQQSANPSQEFLQQFKPPSSSPQQQSNSLNGYFERGQLSLPFIQNPANSPLQQPLNHPALNFQPPNGPQLNNINYNSPQQQFNSQAENFMRFQFEVMNENQGNSIEQGCNPEPIVGQFKPELVDLANGGPLTRMITTCGPDTDCKTIALQSDLNRVLAVLPKPTHNQNRHQQGGYRGQNIEVEGRGNVGSFINADDDHSLVRPPNRRLVQYTEILDDDIYN